jgi:hypothetical protein
MGPPFFVTWVIGLLEFIGLLALLEFIGWARHLG